MTLLDQLEDAEKAAMPGPWEVEDDALWCEIDGIPWQVGELNLPFVALLRNHAADLIAVARAALEFIYAPNYPKPGQKDERTQRAMAEDRLIVALAPLTTEGSDEG